MSALTGGTPWTLWRVLYYGLIFFLLYQLWFALQIAWFIGHNPQTSAFMRQYDTRDPEKPLQHRWVAYKKISPHLKRAVLVAEDARFMTHHGFDWEGIQYAFRKNINRHQVVAGGSTITQQLAKNLFLSPRRSTLRKMEEAIITVMLEQMMTKRRILEIYLNIIEWGEGIYGIQAAAQHYYHTTPMGLGIAQSAKLAAMIPKPKFFEQRRYSSYLQNRSEQIAAQIYMVETP